MDSQLNNPAQQGNSSVGTGKAIAQAVPEKHIYKLRDFHENVPSQSVQFYRLKNDGTHDNGTTLEEMLKVSIERLTDLNKLFSCRENALAITKMEEALMWLNARTANRIARGVEGQHKP